MIGTYGKFTSAKTSYLDAVGYLHASFCFSPVIRLPYQGRSIFRNLSFFRTEAMNIISHPRNRSNIYKSIKKFGVELAKRTISPKLKDKLLNQNRQIVAISDLSIEWLDNDGIPLSFTHDICRLPETSLNGLMALYSKNEYLEYIIPKDLVKKTLVIFGSEDNALKVWQPVVKALSKKKGFNTKVCLSIKAVADVVREFKPDLLIFDCHGGVDLTTKESYLIVGGQRLTGTDVVLNKIAAPLVFLSACNTSPTYGTINTIANAFFGTMSLSVTTTYLPINVNTSSILYIRLLNNLTMACEDALHPNWLGFVSHIIRTSAISEAFQTLSKSIGKDADWEMQSEKQAAIYTELLSFYHRREVYGKVDLILQSLSGKHQQIFKNLIPEYLFYSNLGRSDLIKFETYKEKFEKLNSPFIDIVGE